MEKSKKKKEKEKENSKHFINHKGGLLTTTSHAAVLLAHPTDLDRYDFAT